VLERLKEEKERGVGGASAVLEVCSNEERPCFNGERGKGERFSSSSGTRQRFKCFRVKYGLFTTAEL
jgi:hypothetical protein